MWKWTGFAVIIGLAALIVAAFLIGPAASVAAAEWTGLREKTLWDWLAVLILPLTVVLVGLVFMYVQSADSKLVAGSQNQEDVLDAYLERMRQLMPELSPIGNETTASEAAVDKTINKTAANKPLTPGIQLALVEARANTLTVLRRFNGERKAIVLRYLAESNCINRFETRIRLDGADATGAKLAKADLRLADLAGVDLTRADLTGADLRGADLRRANLTGARWGGAKLGLAMYDEQTKWPHGHLPSRHCGMIGPGACLNPRLVDIDFTPDLAKDLDAARLPGAVNRALQQKEIGVSRKAKVSARKVEAEWDIVDGSKEFSIRKQEEKLWVGHEPDAQLFAQIVKGNCLGHANLRDVDLSRAKLSEANLCGADLRGAHLVEADLSGAEFDRDSKLQGAYLTKANLTWANLEEVDLRNTDLAYAELEFTRFGGIDKHDKWLVVSCLVSKKWPEGTTPRTDFHEFDLEEAYLVGAQFEKEANLAEAKLRGADLSGAKLSEANLCGADLRGAHLVEADLSGAKFDRDSKLQGADLTKADLARAELEGVDLSSTNLAYARLVDARFDAAIDKRDKWFVVSCLVSKKWPEGTTPQTDFHGFDLEDAYLVGAQFEKEASLTEAKLRGADLSGATLEKAILDKTDLTRATLSKANLRRAIIADPIGLKNGKLDGADLCFATIAGNLAGADLRGAIMVGANLCAANLAGADLRDAKLQGAKLQGAKLAFLDLTRTEFTNTQVGGNNTK